MATVSWKNNASGNWRTPADWSSGALPGVTDDVVVNINSPITVTHNSGNDRIASFSMLAGTFAMTGGSLSVLGNATFGGALTEGAATMTFKGAVSTVRGAFTQSAKGVVNIAAGQLGLSGAASSLAGTFNGSMLNFSGGTETLGATAKLNVAAVTLGASSLTLGGKFTYGGLWSQTFNGNLLLNGKSLTLTGNTNLAGGTATGPGVLSLAGSTEIGQYQLVGGVTLRNAGQLRLDSQLLLQNNTAGAPNLANAATGTIELAPGASISGSTTSKFTNAGKLISEHGTNIIQVSIAMINTGNVDVEDGQMRFLGPITGKGTFTVGLGSTLTLGAVAAGSAVTMGPFSQLSIGNQFGGSIAGFAVGDIISVPLFFGAAPSLSFDAATDKLTLTNGVSSDVLQMVGSYTTADFHLSVNGGFFAITHT